MRKNTQFSIIEMTLVFSLVAFALTFLYEAKEPIGPNYEFTTESFLDAMIYNQSIIEVAVKEDLSNSIIQQNWSEIEGFLNSSFNSYGIIISNNSISKIIFVCNTTYSKYVTQRLVSIANESSFDFRIISLEVCY